MVDYPYLRVNRKFIVFDNKKGFKAQINLQYLSVGMEYAFSLFMIDTDTMSFINQLEPPYPTNLANKEFVYSSYYTSENKCSDIFPILLPKTEEGIERACHHILKFLNERFLQRVYHLVEVKNQLVDDIIENPKFYAFPFLTALYVITRNRLNKSDVDLESLLSEENLGFSNEKTLKISFNKAIAQRFCQG